MTDSIPAKKVSGRRSEQRMPSEKLHSVEMKLASLPIYLFKLKDISTNGACFLVKETSAILKHLKVGQILNMRYHSENESEPLEVFKSEIKYIEKNNAGPFKGHYSVGIMLLEKQSQDKFEYE
jgi:hypothetical protein